MYGRATARICWLLVVAAIGLWPGTRARAEDPDTAIARGFFLKGRERYAAKDFHGALESFRQAMQAKRLAEFEYNSGRCYEQLGQLKQAIEAYRAYVEQYGPRPDANEVREQIRRLEDRRQAELADKPIKTDLSPPRSSRGRYVALGVGVAGVAIAIGGATLLGLVGPRYDSCRDKVLTAHSECASSEKRAIARMDYSGKALLGVSGAMVLGAVIGGVLRIRADRRAHAWLSPTLGGLVAGGVF